LYAKQAKNNLIQKYINVLIGQDGQVIPCYLRRQHFICHLHWLFGPTRLRTGPSVVYNIMWPTLWTLWADTVLPSIPLRMTRSCTCTVTARTLRQPLSWQTALSMSADGWPPTDWDSTRTRPSSFGLGRDTACPNSRAWVQLCNWVQTPLQHVTRSGCSGSPSLLI